MLRNEWVFRYSASHLSKAAVAKKTVHEGRQKFWSDAKTKVMEEVRAVGIEVSESEAGASYSNKASGFGPQVMVRTDLQKRLTECHEKIVEHTRKVSEYAGWIAVLDGNPDAVLDLHSDDYLYFFGT